MKRHLKDEIKRIELLHDVDENNVDETCVGMGKELGVIADD